MPLCLVRMFWRSGDHWPETIQEDIASRAAQAQFAYEKSGWLSRQHGVHHVLKEAKDSRREGRPREMNVFIVSTVAMVSTGVYVCQHSSDDPF